MTSFNAGQRWSDQINLYALPATEPHHPQNQPTILQMTANPTTVEVFTPRPRNNDLIALHEQLLTSFSSTAAKKDPTEPSSPKIRQRTQVRFASPKPLLKPGAKERIKVDEVDDDTPPILEQKLSRKARSRSRSILRNASGPRSASRPARCRALSRGRPISRDTTSDQPDASAMTPEEIARELRPESFTRFKRITLSTTKQRPSNEKFDPSANDQPKHADFEGEAKAMKDNVEQIHSPVTLSPVEETYPDFLNTARDEDVKQPKMEDPDSNNSAQQEEEQVEVLQP